MHLLHAALVSLAIDMLCTYAVSSCASPITDDYIAQHKTGTLFSDDPRMNEWRTHTSERAITFDRIKEEEGRTSAYFHETGLWDGKMREAQGVIMIYSTDGKITGAELARMDPAHYDLAVAGQLADIGTTAAALGAGLSEGNPLGLAILPLKRLMNDRSKMMPLGDCIKARTIFGTIGWGTAAWNLTAMAGLGPIGIVVGLAVGLGVADSVEKDAPLRCVE